MHSGKEIRVHIMKKRNINSCVILIDKMACKTMSYITMYFTLTGQRK